MAKLKPTQLEKTIKNINDKTMYGLDKNNMKPYYALINNADIFCDILVRLANNPHVDSYVFMERLAYAINNLYTKVVTDPNNLTSFYNLLNIYLENPELITEESLENINYAFSDKALIYEIYLYLNQPNRFKDLNGVKVENINLVTKYLVAARELYVDDRSLLGSFINLLENKVGIDVLKYGTEEQIEKAIALKVKGDRKINGDYDIDESTIREFDRKIESMGLLRERLDTLLNIAESTRNSLSSTIDEAKEDIKDTRVSEIRMLNEKAREIIASFEKSYLELLSKQKSSIYDEKDTLLAEIEEFFKKKKDELLAICNKVSVDAGIEINRIKKASNDSIGTIKDYVANNDGINQVIKEAANNKTFFERIALVEDIASKMDNTIIKPVEKGDSQAKIVVPNNTIIVPTTTIDEEVDYTLNYFFDKSKKYKERFKKVLERKHELESKGEIFHEKFDDVLAMIIENDFPYMYGPSGCGKTYMVEEQLAKILDMSVITNSHILYEQDIIGYNNAGNGDFVRTNFYRAYRAGNMLFYDELDKSNPHSTIILNAFLKRRENTSYAFPNGMVVPRHPNFRVITAGNTKGSGKTIAYNTGQKMDESVMQRLTPVFINYDNRIEERILHDYPGWFEFATVFREALERTPVNERGDEVNSIGTFTTRDAETIRDYKNDEAFTDEQLIDYQIIENKEIDYIEGIRRNMDERKITSKEGKQLLRLFNERVEAKKKDESRRR